MMPVLCSGKVAVRFVDHNGEDTGFDLPCNSPLTVDGGVAVCPNGHRWPAKELADAWKELAGG